MKFARETVLRIDLAELGAVQPGDEITGVDWNGHQLIVALANHPPIAVPQFGTGPAAQAAAQVKAQRAKESTEVGGRSWQQCLDDAEVQLMENDRDMLARGMIDQAIYDQRRERLWPKIDERARQLADGAKPAPPCAKCGGDATTIVDGYAYCDEHASAVPRREVVRV